jgi:hypothetical protein
MASEFPGLRGKGLLRELDALDGRHGRLEGPVVELPGQVSPGILLRLDQVRHVPLFELFLGEGLFRKGTDNG